MIEARYDEAIVQLQDVLRSFANDIMSSECQVQLEESKGATLARIQIPHTTGRVHQRDTDESLLFNHAFVSFTGAETLTPERVKTQLSILAVATLFNLGLSFQLLNLLCDNSSHRQIAGAYYRSLIRFVDTFHEQGGPLSMVYLAAHANLAGIYMEEYDYDLLRVTTNDFQQGIFWFGDDFDESMEELARISVSLGLAHLIHAGAA